MAQVGSSTDDTYLASTHLVKGDVINFVPNDTSASLTKPNDIDITTSVLDTDASYKYGTPFYIPTDYGTPYSIVIVPNNSGGNLVLQSYSYIDKKLTLVGTSPALEVIHDVSIAKYLTNIVQISNATFVMVYRNTTFVNVIAMVMFSINTSTLAFTIIDTTTWASFDYSAATSSYFTTVYHPSLSAITVTYLRGDESLYNIVPWSISSGTFTAGTELLLGSGYDSGAQIPVVHKLEDSNYLVIGVRKYMYYVNVTSASLSPTLVTSKYDASCTGQFGSVSIPSLVDLPESKITWTSNIAILASRSDKSNYYVELLGTDSTDFYCITRLFTSISKTQHTASGMVYNAELSKAYSIFRNNTTNYLVLYGNPVINASIQDGTEYNTYTLYYVPDKHGTMATLATDLTQTVPYSSTLCYVYSPVTGYLSIQNLFTGQFLTSDFNGFINSTVYPNQKSEVTLRGNLATVVNNKFTVTDTGSYVYCKTQGGGLTTESSGNIFMGLITGTDTVLIDGLFS